MPRGPNEKVKKAFALFQAGDSSAEIARKLDIPAGTVRRWKHTYKWSEKCSGREIEHKNTQNPSETEEDRKEAVVQVMSNKQLTDKQRLFCLYYTKYFNAGKAYKKAYGCTYATAATNGPALLKKPHIREEIQKLKENRLNRELLSAEDIFQKYLDIAMADMTDFVDFGQEEVQVFNMFGPVMEKDEKTGEKKPVTKIQNVVKLKDSSDVDGSLISEIRQSKGGVSVKLADRMKAMDWITKHMDMATEEQKARIQHLIAQTEKIREETEMIRKKREDAW